MIIAQTGQVVKDFHVLGKAENPVYLLNGRKPVLFDAGLAMYGGIYEGAIKTILGKRYPVLLFLTHVHFDHCGATSYLKKVFPGLRTATSKEAVNIMKRENAVKLIRKLSKDAMENAADMDDAMLLCDRFEPFETELVVEDGQLVKLEKGLTVKAFHTPGHTRDFISYYIPERKILIASEAGGCADISGYICTESLVDFDIYLSSIRRLVMLDVEVLCQGHHFVYVGKEEVKKFFERSIQTAFEFKSMVKRFWHEDIMKRNTNIDQWDSDIDTILGKRLGLSLSAVGSLSVGQILEKGANSVPDKTAIVIGEHRKTYKELNDMADALAVGLSELGFGKGDIAAIYMKNSFELVVSFYAFQKLGVIVTWINPQYRKVESEFILRNSGAKGVVIFREWDEFDYLDSILSIKETLPELELIVLVGEDEGEDVHGFFDLINGGFGKKYSPPEINIQNNLSMLIYTSGTTGEPKGAMLTHYQAVRAGFIYSMVVDANSEDIFIGFLPMCHSYGCGAILIQPLLLESTVVLMEKFNTEKVFEIIETEKVSVQTAAPAHYLLELNYPNRNNYDLSSLRACLTGGQKLPAGLIVRVQNEMGGLYLTSMWGASEVGPGLGIICPYPSPLDIRKDYVGQPVPGTSIKIVDLLRNELPD
ncbi:MAG: AMP-binding protein, partial [Deltaproteobacteria bacterium]|nr:AMP-binding protein [Deltaproteobacteria bacterium]